MALLLAALLAGCLAPYPVRVDADVLARLRGWREEVGELESEGGGLMIQQVTYRLQRAPTGPPPFTGHVRLFALRAPALMGPEELLERAEEAIDEVAADLHIQLDAGAERSGSRHTALGVATRYVLREGVSQESGTVFPDNVRTRIIAEAGEDGRSRTAFVAIGVAQVSRKAECPIFDCGTSEDLRTWIQISGDRRGSVDGATLSDGMLYNLVTR